MKQETGRDTPKDAPAGCRGAHRVALAEAVLGAVGIVDHEEPATVRLTTRHVRGPALRLYGVTIGVGGR